MNHYVLIAIFMLLTVPPLLLVMAWSKSQIELNNKKADYWREKRFMIMLHHAVILWRNLLEAIHGNKSEDEIKKLTDELANHIQDMTK